MDIQQTEQILVLNSSLRHQGSRSRKLVSQVVAHLLQQQPTLNWKERDLAVDPLPHFDSHTLAGFSGETYPQAIQASALSEQLISEIKASSYIVIGVPVYNFAIPTQLKAWIDHIARAGVTFNYGSRGPEGKLIGKTVYIVTARGGGEISHIEFQLRHALKMLGLCKVNFVHAGGLDTPASSHEYSKAEQEIRELFFN